MQNQYLKQIKVSFVVPAFLLAVNIANAQVPVMAPPPQDKGLPYTKSAKPLAVAKIKDYIAVFPGSRYAWVKGYKVRLDDVNWHLEAINKDGVLYVPVAFAGVLSLKQIKADVAPAYLADKWVYTILRPEVATGAARTVDIDGKKYVSFTDLAKSDGLKVFEDASGLIIAGNNQISFGNNEHLTLLDIITQFDSPEKLADPDIATEYIPALKRQGKWTDHVKVTPEQMKVLNGPETKWEMTPKSAYDYTGFNTKLLGSKVPPPGVYPRILFSEQDIPMLAERLKNSKSGQKSLIEIKYLLEKSFWDPNSSDGKVFAKLASGNLTGLEWPDVAPGSPITNIQQLFKGEKPDIYNSHVAYVPECLTNMALYCLLTNDNVHGRQAAAAIANYFKLREPLIDEWNSVSDSEFSTSYTRPDGTLSEVGGNGANTAWRNIHGIVAHMNLGLSLDFAGKWMTAEEKDLMRRVIAKATYGRRGYGQDGSVRFRDINWVAWDLPNFLALTAIEGLEGFDKEAYESNCETVKAFAEWGIDPNGVIYESNGKTPGGMQFFTLSMIALARRGDNVWGHPHVRKLLQGQIQMTSPDGKVIVNSGTQYVPFSRSNFSFETIEEFKAFYPENKDADYLLSQAKNFADLDENNHEWQFDDFDAQSYAKKVASIPRLRMPSPTYPGFVHGFLYNTDFEHTTRTQLNLPLTFNAPVHGVFSGYSDSSPNATWIDMMVRPDHYLGGGHHHSDAGMIHFSAMGVDWFTESPFPQSYDGKYHNQVLVDGVSEPESASDLGTGYQAAATYIGEIGTDAGAFATADLTNSYSYRWQTQPGQVWEAKLSKLNWELDPSEQNMKTFAGTSHYKMRPWWATYTYSNYIATSRAPFNPMQYVYRSVGLVRGTHPYAVVVDNLKKDDKTHLYQWTAMLNGGVYQADVSGLAPGQVVLAARPYDQKATNNKSLIKPDKGEPLLLVCAIAPDANGAGLMPDIKVSTEIGPINSKQARTTYYDRIAISTNAKDVAYRVILIPFHYGDDLPAVNITAGKATIVWKGQSDIILFDKDAEKRDHIKVQRDGKLICESK
jgi:hypothetical protein